MRAGVTAQFGVEIPGLLFRRNDNSAPGTYVVMINEAAARLPEAAATTRDALADARRTIDSGSDETLSAGTLVAFGFALGLLVGGANRLLVMRALVPAAAMGVTLLDRQSPKPGTRPSNSR